MVLSGTVHIALTGTAFVQAGGERREETREVNRGLWGQGSFKDSFLVTFSFLLKMLNGLLGVRLKRARIQERGVPLRRNVALFCVCYAIWRWIYLSCLFFVCS